MLLNPNITVTKFGSASNRAIFSSFGWSYGTGRPPDLLFMQDPFAHDKNEVQLSKDPVSPQNVLGCGESGHLSIHFHAILGQWSKLCNVDYGAIIYYIVDIYARD